MGKEVSPYKKGGKMFKEKLLTIIKPEEGKSKRNIENAIAFIILLIATIIIINIIWKDEKTIDEDSVKSKDIKLVNVEADEITTNGSVEKSIRQILSKINGVGRVEVLITYSESSQTVAMYNEKYKESTTEEEDTNGGTRTIGEYNKEKEIIYKEENGNRVPITEKVIMPKMEGALVVAEGGGNAEVKTNIIQAMEALTGLSAHKIQVLEFKKEV